MALEFHNPKNKSSIIKVFGIGGGGNNAVKHMFSKGIEGVDFVICNTDEQALEMNIVPIKIQLGPSKTAGLGAGNNPEVGRDATIESIEEIKQVLSHNTKMIFITAGMGGGTGTGGAPEVARVARELGILTVGIVTTPFSFEGKKRIQQAMEGLNEFKRHVDTLVVISNDKLLEVYGDLKFTEAFSKADDVLTTAAKGISEIITKTGYVNVDFQDVNTVMRDGGVAIMGIGIAEGENRAIKAVQEAINSPLLNDNDITGAKNILINITSGKDEVTMGEIGMITEYVQETAGNNCEIIWGNCTDTNLGEKISVTLIATGFETRQQKKLSKPIGGKVTYKLEEDEPIIPEEAINPPIQTVPEVKIEQKETVHTKMHSSYRIDVPEYNEEIQNDEIVEAPQILAEDMYRSKEEIKALIEKDKADLIKQEETDFINLEEEANNQIELEFDQQEFQKKMEALNDSFIKDDTEMELIQKRIPAEEIDPITEKQKEVSQEEEIKSLKEDIELKKRLRNLSLKLSTKGNLEQLEKEPAYKRKLPNLMDPVDSSESHHSDYSVGTDDEDSETRFRKNKHVHNKAD